MNKVSKWFGQMMLGAVLAAGAFAPATSEAASLAITNVIVTSQQGADVQTWCIAGCVDVDGGPIWAAGAGTVINSPNTAGVKQLILTQTVGFNFDTSEHNANAVTTLCNSAVGGGTCTITLSVNGVNIPLALNNAINNFNGDAGGITHQEAQNWTNVLAGVPGGIRVDIAYADTAHTDPCADTNGPDPVDCLPNPFAGVAGSIVFIGAAGGSAGAGGCTRPNISPCFDAGAIRIQLNDLPTQTPEPGSMFLLGAGLFGLAVWNRKRRKQ